MTKNIFAYIWEYQVIEDQRDEFKQVYGPTGEWVQLFENAEGYINTALYQDQSNPARFLTTDFWSSRDCRDQFRKKFSGEFEKLDNQCERLTESEKFIGDFDTFIK